MAIPAKQRWIIYCVALALTLMAVRWAGGQDPADSRVAGADKASEVARPARDAPGSTSTTEQVPELRLDRLGTRAPAAPAGDPFQARSWAPAPDPEAVQRRLPPPRPQAPPLPFAYMGKMVDGNTIVVFLANEDRNYIARVGETLDGTYRVERIADNELVVTYLPLKIKQTLPFGGDTGTAPAPVPKPQGRGARRDDEDDD
ncbi:MAG TPA: hypothetical protein VML91_07315 [Burkholderiales bacterium]|nr:hypothetical protein [Burkholderiales bacterium]